MPGAPARRIARHEGAALTAPIAPFADGRDTLGRFGKGNPGGPGNPHARRVGELRAALLEAVTPDDLGDVIRAMVDEAKAGNVLAARELLDRVIGRSHPADVASVESEGQCVRVVIERDDSPA